MQRRERSNFSAAAPLRHFPVNINSTDENAIGLLRDWFPKGESLGNASGSEVQEACDSLSRRPRKRLRWKCPWEVYHCQSLHLL